MSRQLSKSQAKAQRKRKQIKESKIRARERYEEIAKRGKPYTNEELIVYKLINNIPLDTCVVLYHGAEEYAKANYPQNPAYDPKDYDAMFYEGYGE